MKYSASKLSALLILGLIIGTLLFLLAYENVLNPMNQADIYNPTYIKVGDTAVISSASPMQVSMYSYSRDNPGPTKLYNQNGEVALETLRMADPSYYEVNGTIASGAYTIVGNHVWLKINERKNTYTLSNPNREEFLSGVYSFYVVIILIASGALGSVISVVVFGVCDIIIKKENA